MTKLERSSSFVVNGLIALALALAALTGVGSSLGWFKHLASKPSWLIVPEPMDTDRSGEAQTQVSSGSQPGDGAAAPAQPAQASPPPLDPILARDSKSILAEGKRVAEHLVRAMPGSLDAMEMQARFEFEFGSVETAKSIWTKLLDRQSNYAYALVGLGNIATLEGQLSEAVNFHRRAVLADPNNLSQQLRLGVALVAAGEMEEAKLVLQSAIAKNDKLTDAFVELATVNLQLGEVEDARKNFEAALAIEPDNARSHQGLVTVYGRLKDKEKQELHRSQHVRLRGQADEQRQERKTYDDVAALRVDVGKLYTDMARVYIAGGNLQAAELLLLRAGRMNSSDIDSRQALAWLSISQGRVFESIRWLKELSGLRPADFAFAQEIARLYAQVDQLDETLATLDEFLRDNPESAAANLALANYYLDVVPDLEKSIKHASEAVRLAPTADAYALLSTIYLEAGKNAEGIEALKQALALDPNNTQLRQMLALMRSPAAPSSPPEEDRAAKQ